MGGSELGNNILAHFLNMGAKEIAIFKAGATAEWLAEKYVYPYAKRKIMRAYRGNRSRYQMYQGMTRKRTILRRAWKAKRGGRRRLNSRPSKRAKFSTRNVGNNVGCSNNKKHLIKLPPQLLKAGALNAIPLFEIPGHINTSGVVARNIASELIRKTECVNLRGIKFNVMTRNLAADPTFCNWAIVSVKAGYDLSDVAFFRNLGGEEDGRARNYSLDMNGLQTYVNPVNTDVMHVMMHKRCIISTTGRGVTGGESDNGFNRGGGSNDWKYWSKYKPIKRQITYKDGEPTSCQNQMFFVYWFDRAFRPSTGEAEQDDIIETVGNIVVSWKDPRN